jgi:hypothetical protein
LHIYVVRFLRVCSRSFGPCPDAWVHSVDDIELKIALATSLTVRSPAVVVNPHWHTNPRYFFKSATNRQEPTPSFLQICCLQPSNVCSTSPYSGRWPDAAPNSLGWHLWPSSSASCRAVCRELERPHSQACVMCGWCKVQLGATRNLPSGWTVEWD